MKVKIMCWLLSIIGVTSFAGICVENAPVWWYTLCIAIGFLCFFLVNQIDPHFLIEKDKNGKVIE